MVEARGTCPYGNASDGFRYRLPPYKGKVARLKKVAEVLRKKEPLYYKMTTKKVIA